jgi:hypothetical protein
VPRMDHKNEEGDSNLFILADESAREEVRRETKLGFLEPAA